MDTPELWLVAGPNGSGKTTLVSCQDLRHTLGLGGRLLVLDPDAVTRAVRSNLPVLRLVPGSGAFTNWLGVRRVEHALAAAIEARRSVLVETVLSTDKYLPHVRRARERGFLVAMIFVALPTAEENVRRVGDRRARGGHDVPEQKIRTRWERAHHQLGAFAREVDRLLVFSNARATADGRSQPKLVATKKSRAARVRLLDRAELPRVTAALEDLAR